MNRYIKQNELLKASWKLKECSYDTDYGKSQEIRKEQNEVWKKFVFYKELNKAMEKADGNVEKTYAG